MLGATERLASVSPAAWQAVRERLMEGGAGREESMGVVRAATGLWEPLRKVAKRWQAARLAGPAGTAMRLFFCGMTATREETLELLGEEPLAACLAGGLLQPEGEGYASPFDLHFVWPHLMFGDDLTELGETVMTFGESTLRLFESAAPQKKAGSILDLGCGAGALALLLSGHGERVVGTDISRRAIQLAEFNAAFNGVKAVEFRQGSLFEPVGEERFDIIVGQLPYVPQVPGGKDTTYLHGGSRGDELVLGAVSQLGDHLTPGGRAFFSVDWPETADDPIDRRLERSLQGRRWRALVLLSPKLELDYYAPEMAAYTLGRSGAEYEAAAHALLHHLSGLGVTGFRQSVVVLEYAPEGAEWRQMRVVPPECWRSVRRQRIDELFETRNALALEDEALAALRLEPAEGAQAELCAMIDAPGRETRLRFAPTALLQTRRADPALHALLEAFRGGRTPAGRKKDIGEVREALRLALLRPAALSSVSSA
jgi:methylase of polypeptide subunit release factors